MWGFTSRTIGATARAHGAEAGAPAITHRDEPAPFTPMPATPAGRGGPLSPRAVLTVTPIDPPARESPARRAPVM